MSANDADLKISGLDLSESVDALRGTCSICCGEDQIMSIVLKKLENVDENISDFALNFPLAAAQAECGHHLEPVHLFPVCNLA